MEIRPIKPEEKIVKDNIQLIAFLLKRDIDTAAADEPESLDDYTTGRGAFDDDGKMCSCFELIPFHARFDGHSVLMGGIGGVASLPEEREKNYIRKLFEYSMKEMFDNGYVFSYLYPFSHAYYRKFGYELNMTNIRCSIPVQAFKHIRQTGSMKLYTGDTGREDIVSVYDGYIRDKNLAVLRTDRLWKSFAEKDPYTDNVYLYIWYNSKNEARGYIQFHAEKSGSSKAEMVVSELIWLDPEALAGIFSFVSRLGAQMDKMIWKAPSFVNLLTFFNEPYELKQEILTYGMNRIVNAEKALELMALPDAPGETIIGVEDAFFPTNTGCYEISWGNGMRSVKRTERPAELACDIQALSQLVTGFASVDELKISGRIDIKGDEEKLSRIFTSKKLFINNYF